jgi:hypothetical protein
MNTLTHLLSTIQSRLMGYLVNLNPLPPLPMTTEEILEFITSGNTGLVWPAVCEIVSICQDRKKMRLLVPHLPQIESRTIGLHIGLVFGANHKFIDFAIKALRFHRDSAECPCCLYSDLHAFNPAEEEEKRNIIMLYRVYDGNKHVDYYLVRCRKCGQRFKVVETNDRDTCWGWTKSFPNP